MVTDAYVGGWEIADHTMTHVGDAPVNESTRTSSFPSEPSDLFISVDGNIIALNALSGIPQGDIIGFRAPYLNYSVATLQHLHDAQFTYDSSMTSATPANESDTDAFWPYTLDYGVANDCLSVDGLCQGKLKLPGVRLLLSASQPLLTFQGGSSYGRFRCTAYLTNGKPQAST